MNLHCAHIFLTLTLFVKLKSSEANRFKFKKGTLSSDPRSRYHKYHRLDSPQFNYYYNLLKKPFIKKYYFKLIKNKKPLEDASSFVDLTRDNYENWNYGKENKFSNDYIDISELARLAERYSIDKTGATSKPEHINKVIVDLRGNKHEVLKMLDLIARRMVPYHQRSTPQSDTDESSSSSEPLEKPRPPRRKKTKNQGLINKARTKYTPKRFQVINNNSGETKSDDDNNQIIDIETSSDVEDDGKRSGNAYSSDESDEDDMSDELVYVQSPTRHLKTNDVRWRRRLKHFLPKRVHWRERDFENLRNYWIDGPKGRYPAAHKTPY